MLQARGKDRIDDFISCNTGWKTVSGWQIIRNRMRQCGYKSGFGSDRMAVRHTQRNNCILRDLLIAVV